MTPFLEMKNIVKHFPGVLANNNINFSVEHGEIHALLGENGAGKSTLMQILYGLYKLESGEISIEGAPVQIHTPSDAIEHGIGMIHQDFMLIQPFTVVENVIVGLEDNNGPLLDIKAATNRIIELSKRYGLSVDPLARIENLPVGVQQRVEIIKLLYRNAKLLILDEPTAVLTPQEANSLFEVLRSLKEKGHSVVFITHKLHEVMDVADRVTVLRDGKAIATVKTSETNARDLAHMMVGRDVIFRISKKPCETGKAIFQAKDLCVADNMQNPKVCGVSFELKEGEILGLAGVDGNGQSELAEALLNLRPITSGKIILDGKDVTHLSTAKLRSEHIAYIPADRRNVGTVGTLSIKYNSILGEENANSIAGLFLDEPHIKSHAEELVSRYNVKAPNISIQAGNLSGGNLQKVVLGREIMRQPRVLIIEQPTRGLDVGAIEYIQKQIIAERDRCAAILLISADLEEILTLSDQIAVIYKGQIMGTVAACNADITNIGLMMAGTRLEQLS